MSSVFSKYVILALTLSLGITQVSGQTIPEREIHFTKVAEKVCAAGDTLVDVAEIAEDRLFVASTSALISLSGDQSGIISVFPDTMEIKELLVVPENPIIIIIATRSRVQGYRWPEMSPVWERSPGYIEGVTFKDASGLFCSYLMESSEGGMVKIEEWNTNTGVTRAEIVKVDPTTLLSGTDMLLVAMGVLNKYAQLKPLLSMFGPIAATGTGLFLSSRAYPVYKRYDYEGTAVAEANYPQFSQLALPMDDEKGTTRMERINQDIDVSPNSVITLTNYDELRQYLYIFNPDLIPRFRVALPTGDRYAAIRIVNEETLLLVGKTTIYKGVIPTF